MKVAHKTWLTILLCLGFMLSLLGHYSPVASQPGISNPSSHEFRGVWLTNTDSTVLFSREHLADSVQRLSRLNFNTVYPAVWNWGYTLYPSGVARRVIGRSVSPDPAFQKRDMLAEMVRHGHRQGLSVIPWFEFGLMAPVDSALVRRHPTWITQRRDGSQTFQAGTHQFVWLNPLHPQVQQFMVDLVTEMVTIYNIDGIQFDDHFGLPVQLGYDAYTVQLYRKEHGGKRPPRHPYDPEWMRWRANKMTRLMARIFSEVKARNPHCLITLSANSQSYSYQKYLQDWRTWQRRGLIEELILQVYRDDLATFVQELERPEVQEAQQHIPVGVGILTGLKARSIAIEQIQAQVQAVRDRNFAGISFFFYESLGDRDAAFQSFFPTPIERPNLLQGWRNNG